MSENESRSREKLVEEYKLIFKQFPELKEWAQKYWEEVRGLKTEKDAVEKEEQFLSRAVVCMSYILLNNNIFIQAMNKTGSDPTTNAVVESLAMIDIFPDTER